MTDLVISVRNDLLFHPESEPQDIVKFIYQRRFGGGHLIPDREKALAYLRAEYSGVVHDTTVPLTRNLGCGIVRVNLAPLPPEKLETLGEIFILSANTHKEDRKGFEEDLEELVSCYEFFGFSFAVSELVGYIEDYKKSGCPPVSHSEKYRNLYHPAYRIVDSSELSKLF